MNIITIFLGFSVGCTTSADTFFTAQTLFIILLGVIAFGFGTAGGVLLGKLMCWATHGKVNPLIGSAGVSAVPMAARVSPESGSAGGSLQLPAHARHGPQRGGRHRQRCGRRYSDQYAGLTPSLKNSRTALCPGILSFWVLSRVVIGTAALFLRAGVWYNNLDFALLGAARGGPGRGAGPKKSLGGVG